jgi:hypothetical protein
MVGHSKWSKVKRFKGAIDAKRAQIFSKLSKEISIAAKGGGDPTGNGRLRDPILAVGASSMPNKNVERAVECGMALLAVVALDAVLAEPGYVDQTRTPIATLSVTPAPTPIEKSPVVKQTVPQRILDPILNEAAALAKVRREQLVILRAESVVWSDGSLGCPEPGMMYTQAQINGYWIVIEAAGQKYDFRVGSRGKFRLCPAGQGNPPSQSITK